MTSRIGITYRMRWMHGLAASMLLGLTLAVSLLGGTPGTDVVAAVASANGAPAPVVDPTAIDPRLQALAARRPGASAEVIVQFQRDVTPGARRDLAARFGARDVRELHIISGVAARMTAAQAVDLGRDARVHAVSLNGAIAPQALNGGWRGSPAPQTISTSNLVTKFPDTTHATAIWNKPGGGFTGKGVGVAVIDTGIAGDLVDFSSSNGASRVVESAVTNPDATTANDLYGHGTHVAGIIAGNSNARPAGDPLRGDYIGVAPDANLISIKASDEDGQSTVLDVIYGLQFAVDHEADFNIRVVNLSLDSTTAQSYKTDPLDAAAEAAWFNGIVVVAAAGNRGDDADAVSYAPANDPYVITVGATDENNTSGAADDTIADWSSRGVTQDGFAKPDISAPGAHIVSDLAPRSVFATLCPTCLLGGGQYIRAGGTSMAAPMVAGGVADILQGHPSWTPDQVKAALKQGANTLAGTGVKTLEVNKANDANPTTPANQGLTPNALIDPATGQIDYTRSSWSRSSWSEAADLLRSSWSRSSWSRSSWSSTDSGGAEVARSSWSRSSWSTSVYK
jgi:serine protease AprX